MNLLQKIDIVERDYWFVRTHFGQDFDAFYINGFIGIGWDYITKQDLNNAEENQERIKARIAREESLDPTIPKDKTKISTIYGKLIRFRDLKKDDIVIIPTARSERLAFGKITDDEITTEVFDTTYPYIKKRKVEWLKVVDLDLLDPIFFQVKKNMHGLSNVNVFKFYIDSVIRPLYISNEKIYLNFDIEKETGIPGIEYFSFGSEFIELLKDLNTSTFPSENISDLEVRMSLNSPGKSAFITQAKKTLLGLMLVMSSTGPIRTEGLEDTFTPTEIADLEIFRQDHSTEIDTLKTYVQDLDITTLEQMDSLFNNPGLDLEPIGE